MFKASAAALDSLRRVETLPMPPAPPFRSCPDTKNELVVLSPAAPAPPPPAPAKTLFELSTTVFPPAFTLLPPEPAAAPFDARPPAPPPEPPN